MKLMRYLEHKAVLVRGVGMRADLLDTTRFS